mgnify:CR=1 FL=1
MTKPGWHQPACKALLVMGGLVAGSLAGTAAQADWSAGVTVEPEVSAAQVGLPAYPGAQRYREPDGDDGAVDLKLWGGSLGLRVVALKYASRDSLPQVAAFYRQALARLGPVLDCTAGSAQRGSRTATGLSCQDDHPEPGHVLLKAGSPSLQTVVGVEPGPDGTVRFDLVRIEARGFTP